MKQKCVIMLANGHSPFDTRIFVKESRSLDAAGYQVSIIVPHTRDELRDGISILAVKLTKKGWQKLIVNPWNIFKRALQQPKDALYIIHDSDILVAGLLLKLTGRKVIYDAHEDTPLQIQYQHWLPGVFKTPYKLFYKILEKVCGYTFNSIIVAEPVISKYFPKHKTFLVRNFAIVDSFKNYQPIPYSERKRRLVNAGTLSKVRGLIEMSEATKLAQQKTSFEFVLGGKFSPPELQQEVTSSYPVNFIGWLSYDQLVSILFDSQVGIVIVHPTERYRTNYPVKLFEFMAAGLPVIASKEGEAAAFVKEAQCGILVNSLDVKEIADAIVYLFTNPVEAEAMGKRGQQLIFNKYNWEVEKDVLLNVVEAQFDAH